MAKLINGAGQRQRDGVAKALAHVARMYQQGPASHDELERAEDVRAARCVHEQGRGGLKTARENGDWDKYEQLMNDPRSGTQAEQEAVMRKAAAHFLAETALTYQPTDQADHDRVIEEKPRRSYGPIHRHELGADSDRRSPWSEANQVRLNLGEKVEKPKEEPARGQAAFSGSQMTTRMSAHSSCRDENTSGHPSLQRRDRRYGEKRDCQRPLHSQERSSRRRRPNPRAQELYVRGGREEGQVGKRRYARLYRRPRVRRSHCRRSREIERYSKVNATMRRLLKPPPHHRAIRGRQFCRTHRTHEPNCASRAMTVRTCGTTRRTDHHGQAIYPGSDSAAEV